MQPAQFSSSLLMKNIHMSLRGCALHNGARIRWPGAVNHKLVQRSYSKMAQQIVLWRQQPFLEKAGHYLRLIRLPIVAYGIYTIGYRQGIIDSHQNPLKFQQDLLEGIIKAYIPANSEEIGDVEVNILSETDLKDKRNVGRVDSSFRMARVATQLVQQAHKYVDAELHKAKEAVKSRFPDSTIANEEKLQEEFQKDKDVTFWTQAKTRIAGDELNAEPWRFVFVGNTLSVNAWVTEVLPKRIFITKSMYSFANSMDEIAFILGHELAHLVLGHVSKSNKLELQMRTTEIVLLSLDPTAGVVTFGVVALLDLVRRAVEMALCRDHEREADELGLRLVALSDGDFDLKAGAKFMYRLHTMEIKSAVTLLDTHPPSLERAQRLYQESQKLEVELAKNKADKPQLSWTKRLWSLVGSLV